MASVRDALLRIVRRAGPVSPRQPADREVAMRPIQTKPGSLVIRHRQRTHTHSHTSLDAAMCVDSVELVAMSRSGARLLNNLAAAVRARVTCSTRGDFIRASDAALTCEFEVGSQGSSSGTEMREEAA